MDEFKVEYEGLQAAVKIRQINALIQDGRYVPRGDTTFEVCDMDDEGGRTAVLRGGFLEVSRLDPDQPGLDGREVQTSIPDGAALGSDARTNQVVPPVPDEILSAAIAHLSTPEDDGKADQAIMLELQPDAANAGLSYTLTLYRRFDPTAKRGYGAYDKSTGPNFDANDTRSGD